MFEISVYVVLPWKLAMHMLPEYWEYMNTWEENFVIVGIIIRLVIS